MYQDKYKLCVFYSRNKSFTLFVLVNFHIHIDKISIYLSILYFKESDVKIFYSNIFLSLKMCFIAQQTMQILINKMPHNAESTLIIKVHVQQYPMKSYH